MRNIKSNTTIKVRYSQFDTEFLIENLLVHYNLKEPVTCRFYDYGMNDIYIINALDVIYYLRISLTSMHDLVDYEQEVQIINEFYKNGISVAAPVRCIDGSFIRKLDAPEGPRYAILFQEAKNVPSKNNIVSMYNLGTMVANMHTIADHKNFTLTRKALNLENLTINPLEMLKPFLSHRQEDINFLETAAKKLYDYVENNFKYEKPYYGYCHGDIHKGNVFFDGEKPTIFDFDCMGDGFRIYDICTYAWNESFHNETYLESEEWQAFLNGYNSIRQLTEIELSSINAFIALRELWLLGINADVMRQNAGCCWFNDSYLNQQIEIFKMWYHRAFDR